MTNRCDCRKPGRVEIRIDEDRMHTFELGNYVPIYENDYNKLKGKPMIGGVILEGNLDPETLGLQPAGDYPDTPFTADDVDRILDEVDREDMENL